MLSNSSQPNPSVGNYWPVSQKEQLLEVAVFLFLIVPSMVLSLSVIRLGGLGEAKAFDSFQELGHPEGQAAQREGEHAVAQVYQ